MAQQQKQTKKTNKTDALQHYQHVNGGAYGDSGAFGLHCTNMPIDFIL